MDFLIPKRWSNNISQNKASPVTQVDKNLINISDRACPGMVGGTPMHWSANIEIPLCRIENTWY